MKNQSLIITSIISCLIGIFIYALHNEWIILKIGSPNVQPVAQTIYKKNVSLFYWHHNNWVTEQESLLWHDQETTNIQSVITSWLSTMEAEQYSSKKLSLESVIVAPNNHLYISFDRHPFSKESCTLDKLFWLEGLLKTLKYNNPSITFVHFLVHHKPLIDHHIECSNAWPIDGFLSLTITA